MIPAFNTDGNLPPGIHWTTWDEFISRFGVSEHRVFLMNGLKKAILSLKIAGCSKIFIDGSFTTIKEVPNDYDACWDIFGVNPNIINPLLIDFSETGIIMRQKMFYGDLFPAHYDEAKQGVSFLDFFQTDRNGNAKGIVGIKI